MARYVIGPDVALRLARIEARIPPRHALLAPTLLRSQLLAQLYRAVRDGEIDRRSADAALDHVRSLKIRLLGDRMLQRAAWDIARQLDRPDTLQAEYLALTRLQADAFVTLDDALARMAEAVVPVASFEALVDARG